jgi:hypothetical protein
MICLGHFGLFVCYALRITRPRFVLDFSHVCNIISYWWHLYLDLILGLKLGGEELWIGGGEMRGTY